MKIELKQEQVDALVRFLYQLKQVKSGREEIQIQELINTIMFGNEFMDSDDKGEIKTYTEL